MNNFKENPVLTPENMYVELLKRSLSGQIGLEMGLRVSYLLYCMDTSQSYDLDHVINIAKHEPDNIQRLLNDANGQDNYRERIFGFPATMVGRARLDNLEYCVRQVIKDDISGDLMETGVWRGGATIFMRGMLDVLQNKDKKVWVVDSFQGLPEPEMAEDQGLNFFMDPCLSVPQETVEENFNRYGLLDERVKFLKGWFSDTLPHAPVERLSVLRLDGDLYKSTIDVLITMYSKLSDGGFIIIDDFGAIDACKQAVMDFREENSITDKITTVDWTGAYWRKTA